MVNGTKGPSTRTPYHEGGQRARVRDMIVALEKQLAAGRIARDDAAATVKAFDRRLRSYR